MEQHIHLLKQFIGQQKELSEKAEVAFSQIWDTVEYKRKQQLTRPEQVEGYAYFVIEGVQRVYYLDEQDRESTLVLTYPFSFAGVLDSFLLQQSSKYYFETLTPSTLLRTSYHKLKEVSKLHPEIDQLLQSLTHEALSGLLERMTELQCYSSTEKFKILLNRSPHILQLIPHKYLANYLGIDPTNFSKLLNTVKL